MLAIVKSSPGPGGLELKEVQERYPGPGEVKIKVAACGICGTDLKIIKGEFPAPTPIILGHEFSGTIIQVGPDVSNLNIGDRVTSETDAYYCGVCSNCRSGDPQLCSQRKGIGTSSDGAFAQYVVVPASGVHKMPDFLDLISGSLCEPLSVACHAVLEQADLCPHHKVVVIGVGALGLLAAQVVKISGSQVILMGLERHEARLEVARRWGIPTLASNSPEGKEILKMLDSPEGVDYVFEFSGQEDSFRLGVNLLRKKGALIQTGFFHGPFSVDFNLIINKELKIITSRGKRPSSWYLALNLLKRKTINLEGIITHTFSLSDWEEAFSCAQKKGGVKVVFTFE